MPCDSSFEWDDFILSHGHSRYLQWDFKCAVEEAFGHTAHYLFVRAESGEPLAALPLIEIRSRAFGSSITSLPFVNQGGLVLREPNQGLVARIGQLLSDWASRASVGSVTLRDVEPYEMSDWVTQTHKVGMLLPLPKSTDELMSSFKAKLRSQVRRPGKSGAHAEHGHLNLLDDFYYVFCRNMRDLGTPVYGKNWFKVLLETFKEDSRLVVVYHEGEPVAASFLVKHGSRMEIPWASSLRKANRISVNMLLYWESMCYAISRGCEVFDFGRSNVDSSTLRFKKQWGAQEQPLYWYQWVPPGAENVRLDATSDSFGLAIKLWQKLPLGVANLLGPHIVKNIP